MNVAPYRIHKMIQDLMKDSERAGIFAHNPKPAFEEYGLTDQEIALLNDGSLEAMSELGVHPNLQMKYLRLTVPSNSDKVAKAVGPLDAFLDRLLEREDG